MASDDDEVLYCICKEPYDGVRFMIECDACSDWFHGGCVKIKENQAADIEIYHCPNCTPVHGPSVFKKKKARRSRSENKPAKTKDFKAGTKEFLKQLLQRKFPSADDILIRLDDGYGLTMNYVEDHGFTQPILVTDADGLGLTVPHNNFSIEDVEKHVGSDMELDVIDVEKQEDFRMLMKDWTAYFNKHPRSKVYNLISLEFSKTKLAELVIPPQLVQQISWVGGCWPDVPPDEAQDLPEKPLVQRYCLMGVKGSYTDFHVDFGGTSVWYHVVRGQKVFYMIEPTQENLRLYETWLTSSEQNLQFFGEQVDHCYECVVDEGNTLFIPAGWIHAVYTPVDSLVFGGNFLHSFSIEMQIKVFDMERRCQTPSRYMFPNFMTVHWFAAKQIHEDLRDFMDNDEEPPNYLVTGANSLVTALKSWTQKKDYIDKNSVPSTVQYGKLLKELQQMVKHFNKNSNTKVQPRKRKQKSQGEGRVCPKQAHVESPPTKLETGAAIVKDDMSKLTLHLGQTKVKPPDEIHESPVESNRVSIGPQDQEVAEILAKQIKLNLENKGAPHGSAEGADGIGGEEVLEMWSLPHLIDHTYATLPGREKPALDSGLADTLNPHSPSTQAAIQGMLSMSQSSPPPVSPTPSDSPSPEPTPQEVPATKRRYATRDRDDVKATHRDQDFIYPSLKGSDSDDDNTTLSRRRHNTRDHRSRSNTRHSETEGGELSIDLGGGRQRGSASTSTGSRGRKTPSTTKQRLGKILKL